MTEENKCKCTCEECGDECNPYYKRLEQENKELKELLSNEPKAMQAFQISYSGLKRDNEILWGMVKDYKSALEEIKEMILYCEDEYNCDRCKYHDNCLVDDDKFPDFSKALVNKINEVLCDECDKDIG